MTTSLLHFITISIIITYLSSRLRFLQMYFLNGFRYREGITKMQESSNSFEHHQQPLKSKRRTPTDLVPRDTRSGGNKDSIILAADSVKLPEIRHFKKSARTIRRAIKGTYVRTYERTAISDSVNILL